MVLWKWKSRFQSILIKKKIQFKKKTCFLHPRDCFSNLLLLEISLHNASWFQLHRWRRLIEFRSNQVLSAPCNAGFISARFRRHVQHSHVERNLHVERNTDGYGFRLWMEALGVSDGKALFVSDTHAESNLARERKKMQTRFIVFPFNAPLLILKTNSYQCVSKLFPSVFQTHYHFI